MKLRYPDGDVRIIDPLVYKEALDKLFGSEKPKPYHRLQWIIEDEPNDDGELGFKNHGTDKNLTNLNTEHKKKDPNNITEVEHIANTDPTTSSNIVSSLFDPSLFKEGGKFIKDTNNIVIFRKSFFDIIY